MATAPKSLDYSTSTSPEAEALFARNLCDEVHIQAFARALSADDDEVQESVLNGPPSPSEPRKQQHHSSSAVPKHLQPGTQGSYERVRKVSAVSDFAPIHQKVTRRRAGKKPRRGQEGLYQILRWPLLIILNIIIGLEFSLYVLIRQIVNLFEWFVAWRGKKAALRARLRNSKTLDEWRTTAKVMDEYLEFDDWKRDPEDPYYDYALIRKVRRSLKSHREKKDVRGLLSVLEVCARDNFAGTESARLYSETFLGTKDAIEAYVDEVEQALAFIRESTELSIEEKRRFFRSANRNVGSSALCFSGGAAFGFYHFGVLKAFLEADLLPRVYNGTSAGGLTAAFVCTHTDEELKLMMAQGARLADHITCFEEPYSTTLPRLLKTGAMFDTLQWARKATFFTRGSMTFREAYQRTGRVLNVSVIPSDRHSPTKLLNYLTAPDCVIWSAIIASSAVPTILNPVVLMSKLPDGSIVPWNWGSRFKDGSLRVDIPVQSLNLLFNVNNVIVSQVNPHVHLFFFASRGSPGRPVAHRKGKGWRGGFLLSAAEQFLKLELTKNFKVIRDLELMPQVLGQDWSSVFLQRFDGSITIHPRTQFMDFIRLLTDPTRKEMARMQRAGQLATWPKLHMISNRFRIEREIFRGRQAVRQASITHHPHHSRSKAIQPRQEAPTPDYDPEREAQEGMMRIDTTGGDAAALSSSSSASSPVFPRRKELPPLVNNTPLTRTPRSSGSEDREARLAIESEAERGFASGSPRFFKREQLRPVNPSLASSPPVLKLTADGDDNDDEDESMPRTGSRLHARTWSSRAIGGVAGREGGAPPMRTRSSINPSRTEYAYSRQQQHPTRSGESSRGTPLSPGFMARLRTTSFPRFPAFSTRGLASDKREVGTSSHSNSNSNSSDGDGSTGASPVRGVEDGLDRKAGVVQWDSAGSGSGSASEIEENPDADLSWEAKDGEGEGEIVHEKGGDVDLGDVEVVGRRGTPPQQDR